MSSSRASTAGGPGSLVQCSIDVPALGGFSHSTAVTSERCFSLCMKTEKISLAETGGKLFRGMKEPRREKGDLDGC